MTTLADLSVPPSDYSAFSRAGISGVLRYLTGPHTLSHAEAGQWQAQGIQIGSILEHGAADILIPSLWHDYGEQAAIVASAAGQPTWAPIFAAADTDITTSAQIDTALESIQNASEGAAPFPVGGYGQFWLMAALAWVRNPWRWQTVAWSQGKVSAGICILQTAQSESLGGTTVDIDIDEGVLAEHGLWQPGQAQPCPTQTSVLAQYGPTWYTHYGFAPPPPGDISLPEISQCKVYGETFIPAAP